MPTYIVTTPEGKELEITAPAGATREDALAYAQANYKPQKMAITSETVPTSVAAGRSLGDIPRQFGLAARYGIEGLANVAQVGTEPIRQLITDPIGRALGVKSKSQPLQEAASGFSDSIGLPKPIGANERVIGDASRLVAGSMGMAGGASKLAQGSTGLTKSALSSLAARPAQQAISATGAGLAGGSVREAGGDGVSQFVASLAGGLVAPAAANSISKAGNSAKNVFHQVVNPKMVSTEVERRIALEMQRANVDWSAIPESIKAGLRSDVSRALSTGGELSPQALARLVDFRRVGATPTRGMLTQDPVTLTREMNLAKVGANSTDIGLQRLPGIQNTNSARLLENLDNLGARNAPDKFAAGQQAIGALNARADRSRGVIDRLYSQARDTAGRSAPLDNYQFTSRASQLLDENLLGGALPRSVETHLNRIASGEVPFDVNYAEQLKTAMGKLQRSTSDGQQRMALGLVRQALEDTPLLGATAAPGSEVAIMGSQQPTASTLGAESIAAFNRARSANRAFMTRVEQTPALRAAIDGEQPDRFVQQYIIGQGSTVRDVQALRRALASDPVAMNSVKQSIVDHLKTAATGGADDTVKFNAASYSKALDGIGDRKLSAFFSPSEIEQLRAVSRVGTKIKSQPDGTAINNSNSGAMLIGNTLDMLNKIGPRIPLISQPITGVLQSIQQRQALNPVGGLLQPSRPSGSLPMTLAMPPLYGGLLASQPANDR